MVIFDDSMDNEQHLKIEIASDGAIPLFLLDRGIHAPNERIEEHLRGLFE